MLKKRNKAELKAYLFGHPLFTTINKPYPLRNLDMEFELMMEHHASGACRCHVGGGVPKNIVAAWKNWIQYTKQDPELVALHNAELQKMVEQEFKQKYGVEYHGQNEEGLKKLRELKDKLLGPKRL